MNNVIQLQIKQFLLVYLFLIIVILIMKKCKINKIKLLLVSNIKMTIQLILAGFILTYIFKNPKPIYTLSYLFIMIGFTVHRVLSKNKHINKNFKIITALSIILSGLFVILSFIYIVIGESILNPQYVIPISGMLMGNTMTGVSLAIRSFYDNIFEQRNKINVMQCLGAEPDTILLPFVKQALEISIIPTINSMVGMGIVSLPGMMTGQILAGTTPNLAILYQIAIMIAICTVVICSCFTTLYFGSKTLYDKNKIISI
ncbi:MAG: ABC transporter permease [Oceanivirga sp.]|nr:ABC transporter permease [Oceanivirga sp.]